MRVFELKKAQANLEAVIAAVRAGEDVYIARGATPIVSVIPFRREKAKSKVGTKKPKVVSNRKRRS